MRRRLLPILAIVPAVLIMTASAAGACGGLVGENGTIQLTRTSTLAAYHNGIERYVTSFEFTGQGAEVGSIIPLPAIPTKVERGGDWTLQRLAQRSRHRRSGRSRRPPPVTSRRRRKPQVILETKIDALDITILKGGSDAVGQWAVDHGFLLTPDAPEVLAFYAARSPIFMAARFDATAPATSASRAATARRSCSPSRLTTRGCPCGSSPSGQGKAKVVNADVFLLTDERPTLRTGGDGLTSSAASPRRARCSTTSAPTRAWSGCPSTCGSPTSQVDRAGAAARLRPRRLDTHAGVIPSARAVGFDLPGGPRAQRPRQQRHRTVVVGSRPRGGRRSRRSRCSGRARRARRPRVRDATHRRAADRRDRRVRADGRERCLPARRRQPRTTRAPRRRGRTCSGPGPVTVKIRIDRSHFSPSRIRVRPHTTVQFVIVNRDPIGHEFIIGDAEVHARHEGGHEASHPPVPGEVSIAPLKSGTDHATSSTSPASSSSRATSPATSSTACSARSWWSTPDPRPDRAVASLAVADDWRAPGDERGNLIAGMRFHSLLLLEKTKGLDDAGPPTGARALRHHAHRPGRAHVVGARLLLRRVHPRTAVGARRWRPQHVAARRATPPSSNARARSSVASTTSA